MSIQFKKLNGKLDWDDVLPVGKYKGHKLKIAPVTYIAYLIVNKHIDVTTKVLEDLTRKTLTQYKPDSWSEGLDMYDDTGDPFNDVPF